MKNSSHSLMFFTFAPLNFLLKYKFYNNMKAILKTLIILSVYPIISCRQAPIEENMENGNISLENPISVKINFLGIDSENNNEKKAYISENNSQARRGNSLKTKGLDINTHYIDDFSFLDVKEISNTPEDNEYLASIGLSASSVKGEDLPNGAKYTILAYKQIGNAYIFHKQQVFEVGDQNPKMELDHGQNYTLFIASSGAYTPLKIENIDLYGYVNFTQNSSDKGFLYQKIENFIPIGHINNVLDIKLKKSLSTSVIIDVNDLGKSIEDIENVKITYQKPKSIKLFDLSSVEYETVTLPIKHSYFLGNSHMQYKIDFYNACSVGNNGEFKFYANIKMKGHLDIGKIEGFVLPVKPWHKHTFTLRPMVCGAYTGMNKTNFREFMCHNLGDGYTGVWTDKFIGNKYAWGKKDIVYESTSDTYDTGNVWKEEEDPCPSGFRIPTMEEWKSALDNNAHEQLRMHEYYVLGWKIGNRLALFTDGYDCVWSSSVVYGESIAIRAYSTCVQKYDYVYVNKDWKNFSNSVRCIKKLPYEK